MQDLTKTIADAAHGWDTYTAARARQLEAWEQMKANPGGDLTGDIEAPWRAAAREEIKAAQEWDRTHGYALAMTSRARAAFLAWEADPNTSGMMPAEKMSFTGEEEWQTTAQEMGIDTTGWLVPQYSPYSGPRHPLEEKAEEEIQLRSGHLDTLEWIQHRAEASLSRELNGLEALHAYLNR